MSTPLPSSDPNDLPNLARCFSCYVPPGMQIAVRNYITANIAQVATNPVCTTPSAPTGVSASNARVADPTTQMNVRWLQPANSGSFITGYVIKWGTVSGTYTNSLNVPLTPKNFTVTGLTPGTTYFFVVQALAFAGCVSANSNEASNSTSGSGLDPITIDWVARVQINGAVMPSNGTITTVDTAVKAIRAAGLWAKLRMVNMVAWDTTATIANNKIYMKTPQLVGCGIDPWSDTGFANANFTINGIQADNAAHAIDCFDGVASLISNCMASPNSASIITYNATSTNTNSFDWGMSDTVNGIIVTSFFVTAGSQGYVADIANPVTINLGAQAGYFCASRTSNVRLDLYFANSLTPHGSIGNSVIANTKTLSTLHSMPIGVLNNNGVPFGSSLRIFSFFALADGLSSADSNNLFNAIQAMRQSFGGGFV